MMTKPPARLAASGVLFRPLDQKNKATTTAIKNSKGLQRPDCLLLDRFVLSCMSPDRGQLCLARPLTRSPRRRARAISLAPLARSPSPP